MRSFNNIISSLFRTALRNIKAGFLQTFQYSNVTHFLCLSDVNWITVTAGSTPQGWIYPHHHCPLTMVWSSEVYRFCFINFASLEALIFSPIRNWSIFSPPQTCAQPACFSLPEQANHFLVYVRIQHLQSWSCSLVFMLNFLLFSVCFSFLFACVFL